MIEKQKSKKIKSCIIILALILFLVNPFLSLNIFEIPVITVAQDINPIDDLEKLSSDVILSKWNNEAWLTVEYVSEEVFQTSVNYKSDRPEWESPEKIVKYYPLTASEYYDGGYEYEVILKEKPASNVFNFIIESTNLVFYHQPPLYEEVIETGWNVNETHAFNEKGELIKYRPEIVVDSYAIYLESNRNGIYGTGKFGHIYRPKIIDADLNEVWGELSIKDNVMSVTVPQKFLDSAKYPIIIDPSIGYTTAGGSWTAIENLFRGSVFNMTADANVDELWAYLMVGEGWENNTKAAIYDHSDNTLVEGTSDRATVGGNSWRNYTLAGSLIHNESRYIFGVWGAAETGFASVAYDAGETNQGHYYIKTYDGFNNPASWTHTTHKYSIYVNYTLSPLKSVYFTDTWYNTTRAGDGFGVQVDLSMTGNGVIDQLWLEHNNTGVLANSSSISINARSSTNSEIELTLNSTVGKTIQLRWFANMTGAVTNGSSPFYITTTITPTEPLLYTSGTSIYSNETDTSVILKGASMRDFVVYESGIFPLIGTVNFDWGNWNATNVRLHLDAMKMWNFTVTRALFAVDDWQNNTNNIWEHLLFIANETRLRDMYFIIEPYVVNSSAPMPALPYAPYNNASYNEDVILPNRAAFVSLWENITKTFVDQPNVIFDIWNEPYGNVTEWLGTSTTIGGAEEVAMKIREFSDQIITFQSGYGIDKNTDLDWTSRIKFNCSYNFMVIAHTYRNGLSAWWSSDYSSLETEMTNVGMFSQTVPILLEEFAINGNIGNVTDDEVWFNNVMTLCDLHGIGYMVWGWHHYGAYYFFNYSQATVLQKWGWIPEAYPYYFEFMARLSTRPRVWSIGNETYNGYDYPYSNNTLDWSDSWNGTHLNVTIPSGNGAFTVRVFWNVSSSYPVNSTLQIQFSNGTIIDAEDCYSSTRSLIEFDYSCSSDVWVFMGYDLQSGWTGVIMGVTNPAKIMGISVTSISKVDEIS